MPPYPAANAASAVAGASSRRPQTSTPDEAPVAAERCALPPQSAAGAGSAASAAGTDGGRQAESTASAGAAASGGSGSAAAGASGAAGSSGAGGGERETESSSTAVAASRDANGAGVPMNNYAFFVKYTYSNECALLAYNFHELVNKLGIFEQFTYRHDDRLISVTLAYIFYRYQVHHCDMALDLAVTLVYLEEVRNSAQTVLQERNNDAFNLICYMAYLAHTFNADRTIRLSDWYKEIGWRSFKSCQQLNSYVFFLFSKVRRFRLRVSESRVKRYIQKLCSVPA
eukprot:TRINITY_DN29586_c0_g1_i2.p1 TRINITY_DN29586_c0_g1~~TRINITY_DN29586_c0_g1_i2.p1  ORF type:complete len:285 (+),score=66.10 TRINITY_DN29586_c0_g1_i2:112-966(+)